MVSNIQTNGKARSKFLAVVAMILALPLISVAQNAIATVPVGTYPGPVALNLKTNKIYVLNQRSNNVTVIDGATNRTDATVATGSGPYAMAVNSVTNKIYVTNSNASSVTIIDGATNRATTLNAGLYPCALAVNTVTNQIYVANYNANRVLVIDGNTNATASISVGQYPLAVAVNEATNRIYVAGNGSNDVTVINGATRATTTVPVGSGPRAIAINQFTNKIYVANYRSNSVSVIDGATNAVSSVSVGSGPLALVVDAVRNRIYVANYLSNNATVIDGVSLSTTTVPVGEGPSSVDINPLTDKVYFANSYSSGSVTMVQGANYATASVDVGAYPAAIAVNPGTNRIYVTNQVDNSVSVIAGANADPLQFVPITPCRIVDTRWAPGPFGGPAIAGGNSRSFSLPQSSCKVPGTAAAYSLNVTVVPSGPLAFLTIWPTGESLPGVSTLNSFDGRVKANAAIVPAGASGAISVYTTNTTHVVLDINGYFRLAAGDTLQFYPLTPCRVLDTRNPNGALGGPYLSAAGERDFLVLASNCQIPPEAQAYSLNFTVQPWQGKPLGYLSVWAAGDAQPQVSTLNNLSATIVANAAIVPAGSGGAIAVYADQDTHLIADIDGYFALPGPGGLSLYATIPCRVLDTRASGGAFGGQRNPSVNVTGSSCGVPGSAQAYVFNATVVPVGPLGYLILWPNGKGRPLASTLNAMDAVTASNMAVLPSQNGRLDAYASGITQMILDISAYFAP